MAAEPYARDAEFSRDIIGIRIVYLNDVIMYFSRDANFIRIILLFLLFNRYIF